MSTILIDGNSNKTSFVLSCIDCSISTSDKVTSNEPEADPIYEHDLAILNGTYDNNSRELNFDIKNVGTKVYNSVYQFETKGIFYAIMKVDTTEFTVPDSFSYDNFIEVSFIHNGIKYYWQGGDSLQLVSNFESTNSAEPLIVYEYSDAFFKIPDHLEPDQSVSLGI